MRTVGSPLTIWPSRVRLADPSRPGDRCYDLRLVRAPAAIPPEYPVDARHKSDRRRSPVADLRITAEHLGGVGNQ